MHLEDFLALNYDREYSDGVGLPLNSAQILAWATLYGRRLSVRSVWTIRQLDRIFLMAQRGEFEPLLTRESPASASSDWMDEEEED